MVPTLASMQCACVSQRCDDCSLQCSDWPKHCSAAIAVRYDWLSQRCVPTTVGQWVAKLANGTNGARSGTLSSSLSLLAASVLQAASPARLGPRAAARVGRNTKGSVNRTVALQRGASAGKLAGGAITLCRGAGINLQGQKTTRSCARQRSRSSEVKKVGRAAARRRTNKSHTPHQ